MFLIALLCVISVVNGHSLLRIPAPWRTRESKSAPCGNGQLPTTLTNTAVQGGATITARWEVTAGDGNGPVTARYVLNDASATTGGFAAGPQLAVAMNPIPQRGTGVYDFTFPAPPPGTACAGGPDNNACHIQFKSTSNWYSCATIPMTGAAAVTAAPTSASPTTLSPTRPAQTRAPTTLSPTTLSPTGKPEISQYQCTPLTAAANTMCQGISGKNVLSETASTQTAVITQTAADLGFVRYQPLVFRNGASAACGQALSEFFCAFSLPLCTPPILGGNTQIEYTQACWSRCETAMSVCDIDPYHKAAYSCAQFTVTNADVYGTCPTIPSRVVYLKNRFVGSQETNYWAPGLEFIDMIIYAGDKLTWKWTTGSDLYKFTTKAAFDSCDFTGATALTGTAATDGTTEYEWATPAQVEFGITAFFGSQIGCVATNPSATVSTPSQKLMVQVVETPIAATVVPIPSGTPPQEIPVTPPTAGPGGFLGDYPGAVESGSSMINVSWMIMCCLVLFML